MTSPEKIDVAYYTDILCVWAYVSEIRLTELKKQFESQINIQYRSSAVPITVSAAAGKSAVASRDMHSMCRMSAEIFAT